MFLFLLSLICTTSIIGLVISVRRNIELLDKLEEIDDSIRGSLEILEEQHRKLEQKSKIELFLDEPIVKDLVQDVAVARDEVFKTIKIFNELSTEEIIENEEEESNRS